MSATASEAFMRVAAIPDKPAGQDPHGSCLRDSRHTLTNAAFAGAARAMAGRPAGAGIDCGSVVTAMVPNRVELVESAKRPA